MTGRMRQKMRMALALAGAALLSACIGTTPTLKPQARPPGLVKAAKPSQPYSPSAERRELEDYYARVQAKYLAQGLMRTDGGGPDTRFTADDLLRDFQHIAFTDEYILGGGSGSGTGASHLKRWTKPIRYDITFGKSILPDQRRTDAADITGFAARLQRVSGHSIAAASSPSAANFHILVMSTDDRDQLVAHIRKIVPNPSRATLALFRNPSRGTHCFVWAQPADTPGTYDSAIVLLRAEHPHLGRQSCIHEEMTQGLGLIKDSQTARPSIFNDDEEFAFLTTHDEMLLKMLYDPRLSPGMSFDEARPIAAQIAAELTANMF